MIDDVLYIIGNGFDLHHEVASSYSSFRLWLKKNDYALFNLYETVCSYNALWSDFEASMAYVSRDYFLESGEVALPDLSSSPDDWTMADILLGGDMARSMAEDLLDNLRRDFHKWVCTLRAPRNYARKMLYVDDYARFLTFNYTTFLESHYRIPSSQVNHIHGVKTQQWGSLVVGHAEDNEHIFNNWWESKGYNRPHYNHKGKKYYKRDRTYRMYHGDTQYLPEYENLTDAVESYYEEAIKPVDKIIASNASYFKSLYDVRTIYVWGFSFSKVDKPYLREIIASNDNPMSVQWYVSIFSETDKAKALNTLLPLGILESCIHFNSLYDFCRCKQSI